ncbi:MAG: hypothetical protein KF718_32225 [Polyangiaceae bacterium]|nr:hypothetical protein [Polyangiaceae bacterium]
MIPRSPSPLLLVIAFAAACGSAPPPEPEAPAAPPTAATAPAPTPATDPTAPAPSETSETPPSAPEPGPKLGRPPSDVLTAPKIAFLINYSSSAPQEAADKKCSAAFAKDPAGKATCMQKERSEFMADALRFTKDAKGNVTWSIYRRMGSTMVILSKVRVQTADDGDSAVAVTVLEAGKTPSVLFPSARKFAVSIPNEYSIELDDPRYGKLVYDAKIGLFAD